MFVAIDNKDLNIHNINEMINRAKQPDSAVSPEFVMEILSKTNHLANIKPLIKNISDHCKTKEEIEPYREFILSCVDGRETSKAVFNDLKELAKLGRCKDRFESLNEESKIYNATDCRIAKVSNTREYNALKDKNMTIYVPGCAAYFECCDFSEVNKLVFCAWSINLVECKGFSGTLDLSDAKEVHLFESDLSNVSELKLREGAKINLSYVKTLPEVLDVSMCEEVDFSFCDMANVKELRYKNKEQEEKFARFCIDNYCKNVVYTDDAEKEKVKVMPKDFGGLEM